MQVITSLEVARTETDVLLTIGSFDGVHRGHRHLLEQLVQHARATRRQSAVLTFHPHPRAVLHPEVTPLYLSTPEERAVILGDLGLELLILLPFTHAMANTPAEVFVGELYARLHMRELWVGADFALGRQRAGNVATLKALAAALGYTLRVVEPLREAGEVISSTRIRNLLFEGRVEEAAQLLGRPYAVSAAVKRGTQRGRVLGCRTANLPVDVTRVMPPNGVYAVVAVVAGVRHAAVASLGVRPTFGSGERLLEVHLLDYCGDLYDQVLTVEFVRWLRPEQRFVDVGDLVAQMHRDMAAARAVLETVPNAALYQQRSAR